MGRIKPKLTKEQKKKGASHILCLDDHGFEYWVRMHSLAYDISDKHNIKKPVTYQYARKVYLSPTERKNMSDTKDMERKLASRMEKEAIEHVFDQRINQALPLYHQNPYGQEAEDLIMVALMGSYVSVSTSIAKLHTSGDMSDYKIEYIAKLHAEQTRILTRIQQNQARVVKDKQSNLIDLESPITGILVSRIQRLWLQKMSDQKVARALIKAIASDVSSSLADEEWVKQTKREMMENLNK
jgi:hypothetical protein